LANPETGKFINVQCLIDSGSQGTFVLPTILDDLGIKKRENGSMSIQTFLDKKSKSVKTQRANISLMAIDGQEIPLEVKTTPRIIGKGKRPGLGRKLCEKLAALQLADVASVQDTVLEPQILIGICDIPLLDMGAARTICGKLRISSSRVGEIVWGEAEFAEGEPTISSEFNHNFLNSCNTIFCGPIMGENYNECIPDAQVLSSAIGPDVAQFASLEAIGISDCPVSKDDDSAREQFNDTIVFEEGRYTVSWPWKHHHTALPTNYNLAVKRFEGLCKRFQRDPALFEQYRSVMRGHIQDGQMAITPEGTMLPKGKTHYLPHQPVITPQKTTTKLRIVFDASAKANKDSPSLNECLLRGAVEVPKVPGIMLRFRKDDFVITSDVQKAFLQIALHEDDKAAVQFFWFKDDSKPLCQDNLAIFRWERVPFGVISSPWLLQATIEWHLTHSELARSSRLVQYMHNNIYVDNLIVSISSKIEAETFYKESKKIFSQAHMNLREYNSNSADVRATFGEDDQSANVEEKILGTVWNRERDSLRLCEPASEPQKPITKRSVLSYLASFFDPMGYIAPALLQAKLIFQSTWAMDLKWDDVIDDPEFQVEWETACENMQGAGNVIMDRRISLDYDQLKIVAFADASGTSYGACVYLMDNNKRFLAMAKSRIKPTGKAASITTPRMELMGLVCATRLVKFVETEMQLNPVEIHIYTDSSICLSWLMGSTIQPVFVENRLSELRKDIRMHFGHVPTDQNPADLLTRPQTIRSLQENQFWWEGPTFLSLSPASWHKTNKYSYSPPPLD
jgi:hypothetical protein